MALGELTKQLAQQAFLGATQENPKEPATPAKPEPMGAVILAQINAMQKALKEDEELLLVFHSGPEKLRVLEIYMPSWQVAVLGGIDQDRGFARAISPVDSLQLVSRVVKAQPGTKPHRIAIKAPKH